jgi:Uma2 family endonuclease
MKAAPLDREATIEDLVSYEGRAELVDGRLVPMSGTGYVPVEAAALIWASLRAWKQSHGRGHAVAEGASFLIHTPRMQVLSPDAAWWVGTIDRQAPVIHGAPLLAVEVRSTTDYGPTAERSMARKRALWFAGGTQIVWDVDVLRERLIRAYRGDDADRPTVYRTGENADAEPAVPGWKFPVDELFE